MVKEEESKKIKITLYKNINFKSIITFEINIFIL